MRSSATAARCEGTRDGWQLLLGSAAAVASTFMRVDRAVPVCWARSRPDILCLLPSVVQVAYDALISTVPLDITLRWLGKPEWADGLQHSSSHIIGIGEN